MNKKVNNIREAKILIDNINMLKLFGIIKTIEEYFCFDKVIKEHEKCFDQNIKRVKMNFRKITIKKVISKNVFFSELYSSWHN